MRWGPLSFCGEFWSASLRRSEVGTSLPYAMMNLSLVYSQSLPLTFSRHSATLTLVVTLTTDGFAVCMGGGAVQWGNLTYRSLVRNQSILQCLRLAARLCG